MFLFIRRAAFVLAINLVSVTTWGQTTLRVEVVDDTCTANGPNACAMKSPYVLLVGKNAAGTGMIVYPLSVDFGSIGNAIPPLADAGQGTNNVSPLRVDQLQPAGYSVTSPYTGKVRPVYYFTVTTLGSGVFMVFKNDGGSNPPFTYVNNVNPSAATANYRFDQCEITFNANITSGANLTSIDAFSMPMQYELFTGTPGNLTQIDQRYYYRSTESVLAAFQNVGAGQALYKIGSGAAPVTPVPGWTQSDGMSQFVRALGPGQAAAPSSLGNPSPYPSFSNYLQSLAALSPAAGTYTFSGNSNGSAYVYTGRVSSDGHGGYQFVLNGTTTPPPPSPIPNQAQITVNLPISVQGTAIGAGSPGGPLSAINLINSGAGYNNPPVVTVSAPAVTGAAASAIVNNGSVTGFTIHSPGSGYTSAPAVVITAPTGPDGVQAAGTAVLTNGRVTNITVNPDNTGYLGVPTVSLATPPSGATATANAIVSGGAITGFDITYPGAGYTDKATVTITPSAGSMDTFLYGATLSPDAFSVAGISYAALQLNTDIVYGAIARDALAAINFGYLNGRYGTGSATWYGAAPTAYPFALARNTNDGYYNPWAAILYNYSDAYAFAFSDRSGPSPLMGLEPGQTLRITLLPDTRLDSPRPFVADPRDHSLGIEWPEVVDATGYVITVLAPTGKTPVTVPAQTGTNRYTLTGLDPGTPYTFTVTATATATDNGNTLTSPAQPVQYSTTGSLVPVTNQTVQFNLGMSWIPPGVTTAAEAPTVNFNGQILTYDPVSGQWLKDGGYAIVTAAVGSPNQYVMTLRDANQNVMFTNIITASFTGSPMSYDLVPPATLYGNADVLAPQPSSGPYTANNLVLGVPFDPIPTKAFAPALYPGLSYSQWLSGFATLSGTVPTDEPMSDGITLLQKYYQGLDPLAVGPFDATSIEATVNQVIFHYRRSKAIGGLTVAVEYSTDLQTWQTQGVIYDPEHDAGDHLQCTARVSSSIGTSVFMRLRVDLIQAKPSRKTAVMVGRRH